MPIQHISNNNIYRNTLPSGHYDMIIVSLVHQGPEMVYYMAMNIKKYVKGNCIWVVHYNHPNKVDETLLPEWAWLVRDTIHTQVYTRLISMAVNQALKFALSHVTCTNIMTLSSGSAFFRNFVLPTHKKIALNSHEYQLTPDKKIFHTEEIDISHIGKCAKYLETVGSGGWQYTGCDVDIEFHKLIQNRNFKYFRGCQWSGQIWPYEVGKELVEDLSTLEDKIGVHYACEEIYLSTYAYNYAKTNNINIDYVEVIIDWGNEYKISTINYIQILRKYYRDGTAVCRLSDSSNDEIRQYLIK
jgi:hypothetical protein